MHPHLSPPQVDLVDCLTTGKVWTPEEIGVQLQTLVIS